jgi:hypothetical protein
MVSVFVGDQDSLQRLGVDPQFLHSGFDLARGKAAIDQNTHLWGLYQQGIALAAAP